MRNSCILERVSVVGRGWGYWVGGGIELEEGVLKEKPVISALDVQCAGVEAYE